MSGAYYNEWEPYCAQWLRNLIAAGHIAPGDVDERSIADVQADDLRGYTQCHFFAGIGGWSLALRIAGWSDDRPVWTGSCPCQPFSIAGKGGAENDKRHLWPQLALLLRQSKPTVLFGEQSSSRLGIEWFDQVALDLEAQDYAVAAGILPARFIGARHMRNRLYFLADAMRPRLQERKEKARRMGETNSEQTRLYTASNADSSRYSISTVSELCQADDGIPGRVGQLRAYGNSIHPEIAAKFITAYMDCRP